MAPNATHERFSALYNRVFAALQLTATKITLLQTLAQAIDLLGLAGRTVIGDKHRHPGQWHRKHDEGQRKPPGPVEDTGKDQARYTGRHQDRILAPSGSELLGVGRFGRRDENRGITSSAAVLRLIPRVLTSRSDTHDLLLFGSCGCLDLLLVISNLGQRFGVGHVGDRPIDTLIPEGAGRLPPAVRPHVALLAE